MASLEQPKKAVSAYWLWLGENRAEIAKKVGSSKVSEVAKAAGEMWKALPEAQKTPFEKRAAAAKDEYEKAMAAFKEQGGVPAARKSKKDKDDKKKVKDTNAPKKPVGGGYGAFLAEKRVEIKASLPKDHKMTDVAKKCSEMWKEVCESEKKKYEDIFHAKFEAYKKELEEYRKTTGNDADDEEAEEAEESPKKETPQKRTSQTKRGTPDGDARKTPAPKRGRGAVKAKPQEVAIDDTVMQEAEKQGLAGALKSLANRDDVKGGSYTSRVLFEALKSSNGLVNPARRALLGA